MGGSIAVTLREPNGTEHRMCRWTNPLSWVITNLKLIEDDPEHVRNFLQQWEEMRADWLRNNAGWDIDDNTPNNTRCSFKFPMTSVYAPYPFLAPHGYGLVVIDMAQKVILSSQNYTTLGEIYRSSFSGENPEDEDSNFQRFKVLYDVWRIREMPVWDPDTETQRMVEVPQGRDAREFLLPEKGSKLREEGVFDRYGVDMRPYVIEQFADNLPEQIALRERVRSLGFVLTDDEERIWSKLFTQIAEDDMESASCG